MGKIVDESMNILKEKTQNSKSKNSKEDTRKVDPNDTLPENIQLVEVGLNHQIEFLSSADGGTSQEQIKDINSVEFP